ncbi:MAG: outer membrane protein assembly factor BamE [Paracoccaceae bacterium]
MDTRLGKVKAAVLGLVVLATASCATQFRNHGYAPSDAELADVIVGSDTRETVATVVGRPSAEGMLDGGVWYYVESRFRHFAYQAPKEIEREVVAISFDAGGRVANIERFGLEDGQVVTLSRRVTQSTTAKVPFLRRLLGSIGAGAAGLFN